MVFNFVLPSRKLVGVKSCVVVGFTLPRFFSVVSLVPSFNSFLRMLSLKFLFNDASSFKYQANLVSWYLRGMLLQNRFLYGELFWLGFYLVFDALANRTFLNLGLWRRCYRLVFKSYETHGVVLNVWQTGKFSSKKYKLPRILATRFMLQALPLSKKDAALPWQVSFQQAATVDSAAIQALYCDVLFFLYFIAFFILYLIFKIVQQNRGELSPRV